jgi:phage FluMu protein Com
MKVAGILEANPQYGLARAVAEAGADIALVLEAYAKGARALNQMQTVLAIYKEMPNLMRDLMRHAIDEEEDCGICFGVGKVTAKANGTNLTKQCPRCKGSGKSRVASEHKHFAVQKVLEMSDLMPKKGGPLVNVNQAVQVNAAGGSDLLARMSKAADELLYGQAPKVIDAEVVEDE